MIRKNIYCLIAVLILLNSCGPINRLTRLKKTPREYSLNYCGEPIIAPRTNYNQELWVVFSDRDNSVSYRNPGGKVKFKDVEFLQPFFVIKEKGEYLRLVKYDPEIIENNMFNGKIKDRKKAEYYGWMHKSRLLLTKQSVSDISTGYKNKQVSIVTDSISLVNPSIYFTDDSIRTFKDPNLSISNGKMPLYEILYTLKLSPDRQKALMAKKTIVSPDSSNTDIMGWVHTSLIKDIGQRLHVNLKSVPENSLLFKTENKADTLSIYEWSASEGMGISQRNKALKYSPAMRYNVCDTLVNFKTGIPVPVVDQRDNYVFNVNGNKITYSRFKELEKDLRHLNILFVFEGREKVLETYPSIVSAIQNLQPSFEQADDHFTYRFGAVVAYQGQTPESAPVLKSVGLTTNYTEMIDYLVSEADNTNGQKPLPTRYTWSGVRKAVSMVEPYSDETNVLVVIGETGYSEWADSLLVERVSAANCRILGYQMNSIEENVGNNFVLQIENMIEHYAYKRTVSKREMIVYVDQLRQHNRYRESSKNAYALDFPNKSMSQGWILFPEKRAEMPLELLTNGVDTLISEVKWDNDNLVNSLYRAFNTVGNHRYRYDSLFVDYNSWDSTKVLKREIPRIFTEQLPAWYMPAENVIVQDHVDKDFRYYLLLSSDELNSLTQFLSDVCANEVDYKYKGEKRRRRPLEKCNCPDDDLPFEMPEIITDSLGNPEYMNTRYIRIQLYNTYMNELKNCKRCKSGPLKCLTLAEAHLRITGCPTYHPDLRKYTIRDIKRKKCIQDNELDDLISYLKQKREGFDMFLANPDKFTSNGQTYYWVDQRLLP